MLAAIGGAAISLATEVGTLTTQLWRSLLRLPAALPLVGKGRRWRTAVRQLMAIGVSALPVVALMSFCLGSVAALQAAAELRRYGRRVISSNSSRSRSPASLARSSPRLP